ncbi:MFS transporter [Aquihabitans sp. G128]|uniref:MFS transporter n=1 Tax=Aquihabitans sp. G128 TaxID=2849779 RepID=UPI001C247A4A|nr:MFS transporter [Aquihabitans sp. G128]QXC60655.1 MFS transporter [Aquihabitans sp. G128]
MSSAPANQRFAAFSNRNFRRYFLGQTISSVGSWAQSLAVIWLVLEITGRSDRLGLALALQFLPMLLLGAPAGVLADRLDNRRVLLATSTLSGLVALTFAIVVASGHVTIWWVYALTTLLGLILALERPTMQAVLFQLVGPDLLPSAVATNSTINSVSRLIGPALAGALIATVGVEVCFVVNAASYVVVVVALLALRTDEFVPRPRLARAKGQLREGLAYVRTRPEVFRPLLVMAIVGTVALNFPTTFPSMVRFGFDRGAGSVGTAMSVSAIGSILGGLYIAGVKPHPRRTLAIALAGFGATCVALAAAPTFWAFVAISILLGFASASFQSVNTVVVQQATDPAMQGRVMALHQMALFGSTPIGALAMGWIIQASSPRVPFVLGGLTALLCAAAVLAHRRPPVELPSGAGATIVGVSPA